MLIVAGKLRLAPEARDAYLAGCHEVIRQARKAPGCLDFALTADPLEPDRINVYERWSDEELLLAFRGNGPTPEQAAEIRLTDVVTYRISSVEAP